MSEKTQESVFIFGVSFLMGEEPEHNHINIFVYVKVILKRLKEDRRVKIMGGRASRNAK